MKQKAILIAILLSVFTTGEFFSQAETENFTSQNVEVIEESTAPAAKDTSEPQSDENTIDENLQDDLVINPENSELQENEIVMDSKNQNVDESVISSSNDEIVPDEGHGFWWWFFLIGLSIAALVLIGTGIYFYGDYYEEQKGVLFIIIGVVIAIFTLLFFTCVYGGWFWLKLVLGLSSVIGGCFCIAYGKEYDEIITMAAGVISVILVGPFLLIWGISGWSFIYTLQFSSVGLLLLIITACIFTPVSIFSDTKYTVLCCIKVFLSIVACIIVGVKMGEKWWLWKYILIELAFVILSWIFSGLLYLYDEHKEELQIIQSCKRMAENIYSGKYTPSNKDKFYSAHKGFIDLLVEEKKKEACEVSRQQKENEKKRILQEQKNVEEARNRENELRNLEKKVKSLSDNVVIFQNAVDQKEPVNLQLLKLIEDGLSIVKNTEMNLTSSLKDEVNRNLKYCRAVFEDCKNLDGYTNSSKLRMETILNLFEDILSTK